VVGPVGRAGCGSHATSARVAASDISFRLRVDIECSPWFW
jgi:hypothetical protein